MNERRIVTALDSANGVRFLRTLRNVVQDDEILVSEVTRLMGERSGWICSGVNNKSRTDTMCLRGGGHEVFGS